MYGCNSKLPDIYNLRKNLMSKIIPVLMSVKNKLFSYKDCSFRVEKSKETTARVVLWKELDIGNVFTMESTFYGPTNKLGLQRKI